MVTDPDIDRRLRRILDPGARAGRLAERVLAGPGRRPWGGRRLALAAAAAVVAVVTLIAVWHLPAREPARQPTSVLILDASASTTPEHQILIVYGGS